MTTNCRHNWILGNLREVPIGYAKCDKCNELAPMGVDLSDGVVRINDPDFGLIVIPLEDVEKEMR